MGRDTSTHHHLRFHPVALVHVLQTEAQETDGDQRAWATTNTSDVQNELKTNKRIISCAKQEPCYHHVLDGDFVSELGPYFRDRATQNNAPFVTKRRFRSRANVPRRRAIKTPINSDSSEAKFKEKKHLETTAPCRTGHFTNAPRPSAVLFELGAITAFQLRVRPDTLRNPSST